MDLLENRKSIKRLPQKATPKRKPPGTVALREIRKYQSSTNLLFPKASFQKLLKEVSGKLGCHRWNSSAVGAIQEASEAYLTHLFENAQLVAIHGGRQTLMVKDLKLVKRLID